LVAVACFLPGRAKDLSVPPRTLLIQDSLRSKSTFQGDQLDDTTTFSTCLQLDDVHNPKSKLTKKLLFVQTLRTELLCSTMANCVITRLWTQHCIQRL